MFRLKKYRARRAEIRRNRPAGGLWQALQDGEVRISLAVVLGFWLTAVAISTLREQMVRYRPDQYVNHDVLSRVAFSYSNPERVAEIRQAARDSAPRVYRVRPGALDDLERRLLSLPEDLTLHNMQQWPRDVVDHVDSASVTLLRKIQQENIEDYRKWVKAYVGQLRDAANQAKLIILSATDWEDEQTPTRPVLKIQKGGSEPEMIRVYANKTFSSKPGDLQRGELLRQFDALAEQNFMSPLSTNIAGFTLALIQPTHELDQELTAAEQNEAARTVSIEPATRHYPEKSVLVSKQTVITQAAWKLLNEEQKAYIAQISWLERLQAHLGMAGMALMVSLALAAYVAVYQPRVLRNHARAVGIAALLLSMMLIAQLAGIGTGPLLIFGIAPTILVAMILAIAYDQRFALGVATLHGLLVTATLDESIGFFLIIWAGIAVTCFLLDEVRTRSKLVEVGGAAALAMMGACAAYGASNLDPVGVIGRNCLYVGAAGLGVGFVVLGILPFIEKAFRITTSMTLLELADASQPLLRRLSIEAPGTYSHSLQVASLAEAAAEAIDANSLLCRVGSYYHDIGKINKADYFCENQTDGRNRHLNLSPNVSLLIIIGHVKDGVEMAKEYNLPTVLIPFIQQHHGTTLVEYFFHQACTQRDLEGEGAPQISDTQYRYPGPKPQTRETAVVMIADAVESATRAMVEPTASRVEALVHELVMKRLLDGQFDEADLTFEELDQVEKALVKALLAIYHGRLAYPSTAATTHGLAPLAAPANAPSAVKSA